MLSYEFSSSASLLLNGRQSGENSGNLLFHFRHEPFHRLPEVPQPDQLGLSGVGGRQASKLVNLGLPFLRVAGISEDIAAPESTESAFQDGQKIRIAVGAQVRHLNKLVVPA